MDKPTLADLLGTKGYKTEKAAKDAVANALKRGTASGKLGTDTRVAFRPTNKQYWIEPIETDLVPPEPEKPAEPEFGKKIEGGNANPPAVRKLPARTARGGQTQQRQSPKAAARVASAAERLARVKAEAAAEAAGEPIPRATRKQAVALPPLPDGVEGPFLLVIDGIPEHSRPQGWALEFSRKLKRPVSIYQAGDATLALTIDARVLRPPRKGAARKGGTPAGFDAKAIELATRSAGVLRTELKEANNGRGKNYFGYLKRIGDRYGYLVASDRSGPVPRYRMIKQPDQEQAAD